MESGDRYGLSAAYSFSAKGMPQMKAVREHLQGILEGVQALEQELERSHVGSMLGAIGREARELATASQQIGRVANATQKIGNASRQAQAGLRPLRDEFRALQAEAGNINFKNLTDPQQIQRAEQEVGRYVQSLKRLDGQIDKTTTDGRILAAQLQKQQQGVTTQLEAARKATQHSSNDIRAEFRALRAEAHNIDFGDLTDTHQFKQAEREIGNYVQALKRLETQVDKTSPPGRELAAQLQRQQTIASNRVDTATQERKAAIAQQRQGVAASVAAGGAAVMLPIVSIGKEAIAITANFNDQIAQVKAVLDPKDWGMLDAIRQKSKDLGATTRFSASDAASGFVLLAQAGYDVDKQMDAITGTLNLAAAGNLELNRATEITVSTLGQFQLEADRATHVANVLAKAAAMGQIDVNDIGESLKYAGGSAKRANLSLEQTSALLSLLSEGGLKGEMAGSNLGSLIDSLTAPNTLGAKAIKELGVQTKDARGNLLPFEQILGQVQAKISKLPTGKQSNLMSRIFGTTGSRAASILLPRFERFASTTQTIIDQSDKGLGAAKDQAAIMEGDIGGSFRNFQSALEGVFIEIGEVLVPVVKRATDTVSMLLGMFIALPKPIKTAIVAAGLITATLASLAVVGGTVAFAFFGLQAAAAQSAIAMTAMASKGIPLTGFFAEAMSAFTGQGIVAGFGALATGIGDAAISLGAFATGPLGLAIGAGFAVIALLEVLTPGFNVLGTVIGAMLAPVGFVFGAIKGFLQGIAVAFKPVLDEFGGLGGTGTYLNEVFKTAIATFQLFVPVGQTVGNALGLVLGVVIATPVRLLISLFKFLGATLSGLGTIASTIASPFVWAATQIQQAWQGFVTWFQSMPLVQFALDVGQGLINALNHNPTIVIPASWRGAIDSIMGFFQPLMAFGQQTGQFLADVLNPERLFDPLIQGLAEKLQQFLSTVSDSGLGKVFNKLGLGGLTESLQGFLAQLQQQQTEVSAIAAQQIAQPTAPTLGKPQQTLAQAQQLITTTGEIAQPLVQNLQQGMVQAQQVVHTGLDNISNDWQDRWAYLSQTAGADTATLFRPGMEQVQSQFQVLLSEAGNFAQRAGTALFYLDFEGLKQATGDFADSFALTTQSILGGFQSLSLSAVAFGLASFFSISPVVLVLGGIGLTAIALATNFLGLRTILVGVGQVAVGIFQMVGAWVQGTAQIIQGLGNLIGGILAAIRGDFSQLLLGAEQVFGGIRTIVTGTAEGLQTAFGGAVQIVSGLFEGLRQVVQTVISTLGLLGSTGSTIATVLSEAIALPEKAWSGFLNLLTRIRGTVQSVMDAVQSPGQAIQAVKLRLQGKVPAVAPDGMTMAGFDQQLAQTEPKKTGFLGRMFGRQPVAPTTVAAIAEPPVVITPALATPSTQAAPVLPPEVSINPQVTTLLQKRQEAISGVSTSVAALGNVASLVAPAIAAPVMAVGTLFDSFMSLGQAIPQVTTLLLGTGTAAMTAGAEQASGAAIAGTATAVEAGVVTGANTAMGFSFGALATAAGAAWAAITGPLLPIVVGIGLVVAAVGLLWQAFEHNFLGISDTVMRVWQSLTQRAGSVWQAFSGLFAALWEAVTQVGGAIVAAFAPLFGNGGGTAGQSVITAVLAPLQIAATVLSVIFQLVGQIIKVMTAVLLPMLQTVLFPIRVVATVLQGVLTAVGAIASVIGSIFSGLISTVGSVFQTLWNLIPAPIQWLIQMASQGMGAIGNFIFGGDKVQPAPLQQFAAGGLVSGLGTGTSDSIPALLSNGEYVMPAGSVPQNLGTLEAMRNGAAAVNQLQLVPLPLPPIPPLTPAVGGGAVEIKIEAPITIQGGLSIQGGSPAIAAEDLARQVLELAGPMFEQMVIDAMRRRVEMAR